MPTVTLDFCGELGALVRPGRRSGSAPRLVREVREVPSLKDAIEAAGIPHVEVGQVRAPDGRTLTLRDRAPTDGPIAVHPAPPVRLDPVRFVCDQHLGKLARLLRIMGCDVAWGRDWLEPEIARRAVNEDRALLSRGRSVLMRRAIVNGQLVLSDRVDDQAVEVVRRFMLGDRLVLFGRCGLCNAGLHEVARTEVAGRIPPRTAAWIETYYLCDGCDKLYWQGTHVAELRRRVETIRKRSSAT